MKVTAPETRSTFHPDGKQFWKEKEDESCKEHVDVNSNIVKA